MKFFSTIAQSITQLIYPNICAACGEELLGNEHLICVTCTQALPKTNFHLQHDNPVWQKFYGRVQIENATSLYYFNKNTLLQELLHALKYNGKQKIGVELGRRFAKEIVNCAWLKNVDYLIPVPISAKKIKQRGFNQSECIVEGLHQILNIPTDNTSIIRSKHTRSQTTMHINERIQNVKNAFAMQTKNLLENKHVILVDDVLTTGATLESCAQEILALTNTKVSILTLAYAIE